MQSHVCVDSSLSKLSAVEKDRRSGVLPSRGCKESDTTGRLNNSSSVCVCVCVCVCESNRFSLKYFLFPWSD